MKISKEFRARFVKAWRSLYNEYLPEDEAVNKLKQILSTKDLTIEEDGSNDNEL